MDSDDGRTGNSGNPHERSSAVTRGVGASATPQVSPELEQILESAARLQRLVPDAVLVGGSVAAMYAGHRLSYDHDHILTDLRTRFETVLDALEEDGDWVTNRVVPQKLILGELGGIESGLRQLIREVPLEVQQVRLANGALLQVPTPEEAIRVKAYLLVKRNTVRDHLGVAALSDWYGIDATAHTLAHIDRYYTDPRKRGQQPVATELATRLLDAHPKDTHQLEKLDGYKGIIAHWQDWSTVRTQLSDVGTALGKELGDAEVQEHRRHS